MTPKAQRVPCRSARLGITGYVDARRRQPRWQTLACGTSLSGPRSSRALRVLALRSERFNQEGFRGVLVGHHCIPAPAPSEPFQPVANLHPLSERAGRPTVGNESCRAVRCVSHLSISLHQLLMSPISLWPSWPAMPANTHASQQRGTVIWGLRIGET